MSEVRPPLEDPRLDYPATQRNREAILAVLREVLPAQGTVLELASGSGQHVAFFASALPQLRWQPSDHDPSVFASIAAWTADLDNVAAPLQIDATSPTWPLGPDLACDAVICANMIHISPWAACLGLLDGVSGCLREAGPLCLYGPFMRGGVHTAPSNEAFDHSLRSRDPSWGVRDLDVVEQAAAQRGLVLDRVFEMPANNLTVVLRRTKR
ncbi:DUF938 domain-containing protein [Enhygromyxa salina]|uniref:SAM-dependent methyltransferase n=1 Tax=Enhygromyxa salina TaxID=215803 RepID=A0A2S9YLG1_9BACT|nr:DUF938 domain-containing protein [Enhygromyxa salina]PRQ05937.1 hypothetical protein ENSA7_43530 [Enhygromyxa salina]